MGIILDGEERKRGERAMNYGVGVVGVAVETGVCALQPKDLGYSRFWTILIGLIGKGSAIADASHAKMSGWRPGYNTDDASYFR